MDRQQSITLDQVEAQALKARMRAIDLASEAAKAGSPSEVQCYIQQAQKALHDEQTWTCVARAIVARHDRAVRIANGEKLWPSS